ncbi:unnamed protein product, partial [Closterium sp. NIES-53]
GRAVDFEVWLDDLQLFLQCDSKDGLSLFDLTSGASTAPTADADSTVRSQWLTRDAVARLAVRNHLPSTERAHFSQYKSARALYDAVVARYSSPTTAALSRLMLPYLFPDLAAFSTGSLSLPLPYRADWVGASVAAVEAVEAVAEAVEAAAAVLEVAEEVVLVAVLPRSVEALVAASVSSSCAPVRPRPFSSFVSGTLGVGGLGVQVPVRTFFAHALVAGRCVVSHTPRSTASAA